MNGPAGSIVHRNGVRVLATPPAASTGAPPGARFCAPPRVAHHGSAICPDVLRVSDEQEPVWCQLGRVDDDPVFVQWPQWFLNAANDLCFVTSCNISKRVLETRHVCFEWQVQFFTRESYYYSLLFYYFSGLHWGHPLNRRGSLDRSDYIWPTYSRT